MTPIRPEIIAAAQRSQRKYGIPASISLAQFGVESGWGAHMPPGSFNPFGIKAVAGQPYVASMTREVIRGVTIHVSQKFAKYPSFDGAFEAHAKLLGTRPQYAKARAKLPNVDAFAHALTGVYATDPNYGKALVATMRARNLYQYDTPAAHLDPPKATPVAPSVKPKGILASIAGFFRRSAA